MPGLARGRKVESPTRSELAAGGVRYENARFTNAGGFSSVKKELFSTHPHSGSHAAGSRCGGVSSLCGILTCIDTDHCHIVPFARGSDLHVTFLDSHFDRCLDAVVASRNLDCAVLFLSADHSRIRPAGSIP